MWRSATDKRNEYDSSYKGLRIGLMFTEFESLIARVPIQFSLSTKSYLWTTKSTGWSARISWDLNEYGH